jgi:hypothetical protein
MPPPLWAASFYGGSSDAALVPVQATVDAEHATYDSGSTPALMAAQEGHTDLLQVLVQVYGQVEPEMHELVLHM